MHQHNAFRTTKGKLKTKLYINHAMKQSRSTQIENRFIIEVTDLLKDTAIVKVTHLIN